MVTVLRRSTYPFGSAFVFVLLLGLGLSACQSAKTDVNMPQTSVNPVAIPAYFPQPPVPADNPITPEKVALGRQLFYEVKLSRDDSKACASCHQQSASFCDAGKATSVGVSGQTGTRNAPALINLAYDTTFFWDGHAHTLEQQALIPITNPIEMASDTFTVLKKLGSDPYYQDLFAKAFGDNTITFDRIAKALATFERTLISANSPYDRYYYLHDSSGMSASALRGMYLFFDKNNANCGSCHSGVNFTDNGFYSTGFLQEYYNSDPGRKAVTSQDSDNGRFKTPTLRNVAMTGPYTANGGTPTLFAMMQHYNTGGNNTKNQDSRIKPLYLTDDQLNDIISFLGTLTDQEYMKRSDFAKPQ